MTVDKLKTAADSGGTFPRISVVVIGRNEGERLSRCLQSVRDADYPSDRIELIYVDSASTDDSCRRAEDDGARVIVIHPERPSAATGRNAGLEVATGSLVQFLDGDTVLDRAWLRKAQLALNDESICGVFGRRDEVAPEATIYNFWMHHDWYAPPGRVEACGGDVMFRRDVLVRAGGYDATLIAGEERDLCYRLIRDQKVGILRLDEPMTGHDSNMTRFSEYWRRCTRTGHAYAEVGGRYSGMRVWRRARWRNLIYAFGSPLFAVISVALWTPWPLGLWVALVVASIMRNALRMRGRIGTLRGALLYATHHFLAKTPMALGQISYWRRALFSTEPKRLIEYRSP